MPPRFPSRIYVDTSFILASLIRGLAHSEPCIQFCEQLADHHTTVYCSDLLRLEIANALRNLVLRRPAQLAEPVRQRYQLTRWAADSAVRRRWMRFGCSQLAGRLGSFEAVVELPLSTAIWERSVRLMAAYDLKSNDALHVATALTHRLKHFATTDREFEGINGLQLWLIRDGP